MARALWKGAISFGLVNIPVELHPAEDRKSFQFSMLDKRDLSPVGYKRYSKRSGKEVPWSDIVKGYEYAKGKFVVLSDEDFRRANVRATQTIDIDAFVPADEVPAEYFDTPYYLAPGRRGDKPYALLRETLQRSGRIAIAQVVIRTTQHLSAVIPHGRALMLITLRYHDELLAPTGLELPAEGLSRTAIGAKEAELAKRLVDGMTQHFNPAKFKDSYHRDLMARIRQKIRQRQTKVITEPEETGEAAPRSAQVIDLAALLRQSLDKHARGTTVPAKRSASMPAKAVKSAGKRVAATSDRRKHA